MIVAIIQARMGSSRLPGKIMLKTCGKTFLEHVIDRVIKSKTLDKVVVATSLNKNDDVIEDLCKKKNILYFRGSENDVLSRYKMAADKTHADISKLARKIKYRPKVSIYRGVNLFLDWL